MEKNWKKEVSRDLMALGSIPFLILVVVRVATVGNFRIIAHMGVALFLPSIFSLKVKPLHYHSSIIAVLIIFTSLYYASYLYTAFAVLIGVLAFYGIKTYLKKEKVYLSVLMGVICSIISYLVILPLQIPNL